MLMARITKTNERLFNIPLMQIRAAVCAHRHSTISQNQTELGSPIDGTVHLEFFNICFAVKTLTRRRCCCTYRACVLVYVDGVFGQNSIIGQRCTLTDNLFTFEPAHSKSSQSHCSSPSLLTYPKS